MHEGCGGDQIGQMGEQSVSKSELGPYSVSLMDRIRIFSGERRSCDSLARSGDLDDFIAVLSGTTCSSSRKGWLAGADTGKEIASLSYWYWG
jgi:hypothetical protein